MSPNEHTFNALFRLYAKLGDQSKLTELLEVGMVKEDMPLSSLHDCLRVHVAAKLASSVFR